MGIDLKIASLKLAAYCDRSMAIPLLINNLDDDDVEVRLVCIHQLRNSKAKESMPYLEKKLDDKEWSVRISAAKTLLDFGFDKAVILMKMHVDPQEEFERSPYIGRMW